MAWSVHDLWSCEAFYSGDNRGRSSKRSWIEKDISPRGSLKNHIITDITVIHEDTHCTQLEVDSQVFPVPTAHVSQHAARWERAQEVTDTRPGGVAGAAEVWSDGIVHPVHILLLQKGCVGMATGKWGRGRWRGCRGGSLTVTGRGEGWREGGRKGVKWVDKGVYHQHVSYVLYRWYVFILFTKCAFGCQMPVVNDVFYCSHSRFSPQRQGSFLILRKVREVRVPLLLKVRLLLVRSSGVVSPKDCGSHAGTMSNLRGVILREDNRQLV